MNGFRKILVALALWMPLAAHALDVTAKSATIVDAKTGKVLWSKDPDTVRYPASTTKIMTALLLLEHCAPDDVIVAPMDVTKVKEASMHLKPGERVSVRDMLYAIMLRSANDGCYAVACHIAGSVPRFSQMMNDRAKALGCTHTHFDNPNGLNDNMHYTTAHDLALIAREAMKIPLFRDVVHTVKHEIARSINQHDTMMVNHNKWLAKDLTADGIKTGYTVPAGHCYVGSATRNGYRIITVVMNSPHWQKDHQEMLQWAFGNYERLKLVQADAPVDTASVVGGAKAAVSVAPVEDLDSLVAKPVIERGITRPVTRTELANPLKAPIRKGQIVGTEVVTDPEGFEQRVPLAATEDVPSAAIVLAAKRGPGSGMFFIGGALLFGTAYARGRARRTRFSGTPRLF